MKTDDRDPLLVQSVASRDIEELLHSDLGWDFHMVQLELGNLTSEIHSAATQRVLFQEARFNRALHQQGNPPPRRVTFGIPGTVEQRFLWRGREVAPADVIVFGPRTELDACTRRGFHVFVVSLTLDHLSEVARQADMPGFPTIAEGDLVLRGDPAGMNELRAHLAGVAERIRTSASLPERNTTAEMIEYDVPFRLLATLAAGRFRPASAPLRPRTRALRKALDYIVEHERRAPAIREVATATGFTERTLQITFREHFGVSPKRYLLSKRLRGVQKGLRRAEPGRGRISDIANQWGFWHMGQFAADYRRLFGELPSATLTKP